MSLEEELQYTHTNENLLAINNGMPVDESDVVLTPAGSGDAVFAFLERAGRVVVADRNLAQLKQTKERAGKLADGDFEGFLAVEKFGSCDGLCYGRIDLNRARQYVERRDRYFLEEGRMAAIRQHLGNLVFARNTEHDRFLEKQYLAVKSKPEPTDQDRMRLELLSRFLSYEHDGHIDIFDAVLTIDGLTRMYLSNIDFPIIFSTPEGFKGVVQRITHGGMVYVANPDLVRVSWNGFSIDLKSFGLKIDGERTKIARRLESDPSLGDVYGTRWQPLVYRRAS